jgi:hypothetical protein
MELKEWVHLNLEKAMSNLRLRWFVVSGKG